MGYLKNGNYMVVWGALGKDARYREYQSGKRVANFGICYESLKGQNGRYFNKYINVDVWGDLALYAGGLEQGDSVLVAGTVERDDYNSQKKGSDQYKIVCRNRDIVLLQQKADTGYGADYDAPGEGAFSEYEGEEGTPFDEEE